MNKELHPSALMEGTIVYIENQLPMRFVKADGNFLIFHNIYGNKRKAIEIKTYIRLLNKNLVDTNPVYTGVNPPTNKDFWDDLISGL